MKKLNLKILSIIVLSFINLTTICARQHNLSSIPDPKKQGQDHFVSNPDGILNNVSGLDEALAELEKQTKVEFAVVVVNNFDENQEDFEFAKALFDKWKIGKAGSNNGLLLLIAKDRRKYRFISGDGVEGLLPDIVLKQIGERQLVPAFRENQYDEGILQAIDAIKDILTNPNANAEIQSLISKEKQNSFDWQFPLGVSAVIIFLFIFIFRVVNKQAKKNTALVEQTKEAAKLNLSKRKSGKKQPIKITEDNKNGYDKVLVNGCVGTFFFVFSTVFIFVFAGGFGFFENFKISYIPYILYVILAIALFFRYYAYVGNLRRAHFDDENFLDAVKSFHAKYWWLIVFSPLIIIPLIIHAVKKAKTAERFTPVIDSNNQEMVRIDRDINLEGEPFLSKGQRKEELIKAYDYDIWQSVDGKEHTIKVWPAEEYDSFVECPKCKFRTYQLNKQETTKSPSYSSTGTAKLTHTCHFCNHVEFIKWVTLAKLVQSTSSSSSSSSGGSSSSSGSWGGGSSSGGGAGGSW